MCLQLLHIVVCKNELFSVMFLIQPEDKPKHLHMPKNTLKESDLLL